MTVAPFDAEQYPRRVNLGCGWDVRPGYLNVDLHDSHAPDLVADVCDLSMLPDAYYDEVVAQDVLEHLRREQAPVALAEWARITRVGGTLVLRVPNLIGLLEMLSHHHDVSMQTELVQCLYGTQAYDGDFHQNGFTELLLRHELAAAGFGQASFTPRDHWLFDVAAVRMDDPHTPTIADCSFMVLGQVGIPAPTETAGPATIPAADLARELGRRVVGRARREAGRLRRRVVKGDA